MDKETIYNKYAKGQGYKNWSAILFQFQDDFNYASPEDENNAMNWIEHHINSVTDLIQEELLKKASKQLILGQTLNKAQQAILNTEIL